MSLSQCFNRNFDFGIKSCLRRATHTTSTPFPIYGNILQDSTRKCKGAEEFFDKRSPKSGSLGGELSVQPFAPFMVMVRSITLVLVGGAKE